MEAGTPQGIEGFPSTIRPWLASSSALQLSTVTTIHAPKFYCLIDRRNVDLHHHLQLILSKIKNKIKIISSLFRSPVVVARISLCVSCLIHPINDHHLHYPSPGEAIQRIVRSIGLWMAIQQAG